MKIKVIGILAVMAITFGFTQNAPYVDGAAVNSEFDLITSDHMDQIRGKKILFGSRSFGLNIGDGLYALQNSDSKYALNRKWGIRASDGVVIPDNVFDSTDIVHFICTNSPHSARVKYLDSLVRNHYGDELDAILLFPYKYMSFDNQDYYFAMLDSLQKDYPHIKIIYGGNNIYPDWTTSNYSTNKACSRLRLRALDRCKDQVPYYDHLDVLSTTEEGTVCGFTENDTLFRVMCADYNNGTDALHPNTAAGELRLGKSFILMLAKLFCTDFNPDPDTTAPSAPSALQASAASPTAIDLTWSAAADAESGVKFYRVYRDGAFTGSSYGTEYADAGLTENTAHAYTVSAVNNAGLEGLLSGTVTCTTLADTTPPSIAMLSDTQDSVTVTVVFSEILDQTSAENISNYSISEGVTVTAASLSGATVTLTTSPLPAHVTCTLYVDGVTDLSSAANAVASGTFGTFRYTPVAYTDDAIVSFSFNGNLDENTGSGVTAKWTGTASYGAGRAGQGLDLDRDSANYVIINRNALLHGHTAMTISLWAARTSDTTGGKLYLKHTVYDLNLSSTGVNGYVFNTAGDRGNFGGTADNADTDWHLYTLTFDGSAVRVYVDDQLVGTTALAGTVAVQSRDVYVGRDPWGSTFDGAIDEFRLFDRCLDSLEVVAMYGGGTSSGNADSLAVRSILNANGKTGVSVASVTDWNGDRVIRLQLNEMGITDLTDAVGSLTALEELYVYADTALGLPYLAAIPDAIGNCTALQKLIVFNNELSSLPAGIGSLTSLTDLNLSGNQLASLPPEITALTGLTSLSLADNRLCDLTGAVKTWADTYDPDWAVSQMCTPVVDTDAKLLRDYITIIPCAGALQLVHPGNGIRYAVTIYDMDGNKVFSLPRFTEGRATWHTAQPVTGIYFISISDGSGVKISKAVITR